MAADDQSGRQGGRRKVLFVSPAGGHLAQMLQLRPWWERHDRRWVTVDRPDARSKLRGEVLIPAAHPTSGLAELPGNALLAGRVLTGYRPDVVVSNSADVALPFFVLARALRIPTVFVEVYDRVDDHSRARRLCQPFTSRHLAQRPEQEGSHPEAVLIGPVY